MKLAKMVEGIDNVTEGQYVINMKYPRDINRKVETFT